MVLLLFYMEKILMENYNKLYETETFTTIYRQTIKFNSFMHISIYK